MGDNGKDLEVKKQFLTIEYATDGTIELKGQIINNEMLAIWLLDKAKDMVKTHTLQKLQAQNKISHPHGILNFARNLKRR